MDRCVPEQQGNAQCLEAAQSACCTKDDLDNARMVEALRGQASDAADDMEQAENTCHVTIQDTEDQKCHDEVVKKWADYLSLEERVFNYWGYITPDCQVFIRETRPESTPKKFR